jgi:hypothetical protein
MGAAVDSLNAPTRAGAERWLVLALGLPGVLLACGIVVLAGLSAAGLVPFARDQQLTLAEAAALRDRAEIVRLIRRGGDPRALARVRAGIIGNGELTLTPMEAAIMKRRTEVMSVLVDVGAGIRPDEFAHYWCLAKKRHDPRVVAAVESQVPRPRSVDCSAVRTALDERDE